MVGLACVWYLSLVMPLQARIRLRHAPLVLFGAAFTVVGVGCNKEAKPEPPKAELALPATPQGASAEPAAPAAVTGEPKYSEPNFELSIEPPAEVASGKPAEAKILLVAKSPFHVNQNYPYKFKVKASDGLKSDKPVFSSEAVKLETQRATMTVAFTPEASGSKKLSGQFAFSVCTDDKCLIEKRDLVLALNVP